MANTGKSSGVGAAQLKSVIERVERLEDERAEVGAQIREVYAEAKGNGFDARALRQLVRLRRMDPSTRAEQEALLDLYKSALGME